MDKNNVKTIDGETAKQTIKQSFEKLYNSTDNLIATALTDDDDMEKINSLIVINDEDDLLLCIQRLCKTVDLLMRKTLKELIESYDFIGSKEGKDVARKVVDAQYKDLTKEEKIQAIKNDHKKIVSDLNTLKCRTIVVADFVDECFDGILNCYGSSLLAKERSEI